MIHSELAKESNVALTAFVLITMNEEAVHRSSDRSREEKIIARRANANAIKCLQDQVTEDSDLYSQALTAYGFNLIDVDSSRLEQLMEVAIRDTSGMLYWKTDPDSSVVTSEDIEISAYMVLHLLNNGQVAESLKIIKWLATQRNSYGGFKSTQDTMIAIQAMAEYSKMTRFKENDLSVQMSSGHKFEVTEDNELLLQMEKLELDETTDTSISADVSGKGCILVQSVLR